MTNETSCFLENGEIATLEKVVNPIDVFSFAEQIFIVKNKINNQDILMFILPYNTTSVGNAVTAIFLSMNMDLIAGLLDKTDYGKRGFISVVEMNGDMVWRSSAKNQAGTGENLFEDLKEAETSHAGEITKIKNRMHLKLSGVASYKLNNEKKCLLI